MTNHGFPDDETALSVDDEGDPPEPHVDPPAAPQGPDEAAEEQVHTDDRSHSHGANDNELITSRRAFLGGKSRATAESAGEASGETEEPSPGSDSGSDTDSSTDGSRDDRVVDTESGANGFITDGLTQNELIAFISGFLGSYGLAAMFYWGMLSTGLESTPAQMWILLGILVLAPLALMFGLQQTSGVAGTILNRGSR